MKTQSAQSIFKYKINKGPLHKVPAIIKLTLLLPISIICMSLPPLWLGVGIGAAIVIAFICRFTIIEQLTDLKPALYYGILMYALSIFSNTFDNWEELTTLLPTTHYPLPTIILPNKDFLQIALRLILIIQLSALLFRTTTSMEIRESLCRVNKGLGNAISLFLSFIPQIFENWSIINKAWKARGGKNGIIKIKTTVFILISLSMEKAAMKAKALQSRRASVNSVNSVPLCPL